MAKKKVLFFVVSTVVFGSVFLGYKYVPKRFPMPNLASCPDEVGDIVANNIFEKDWHRNDYSNVSVHVDGDDSERLWTNRLEERQKEINQMKDWAHTVTDECVQKEYISWANFYQRQLNSAWSELKKQKKKREYEKEHGEVPKPPSLKK